MVKKLNAKKWEIEREHAGWWQYFFTLSTIVFFGVLAGCLIAILVTGVSCMSGTYCQECTTPTIEDDSSHKWGMGDNKIMVLATTIMSFFIGIAVLAHGYSFYTTTVLTVQTNDGNRWYMRKW